MDIVRGVAAAVILLVLVSGRVEAGQVVQIVGDAGYPPYMFLENGDPAGVYSDILEEAFSRMPKYDLQLKLVPWKRAMTMTESGEVFGTVGVYHRPKERPWIAPYSQPILAEEVVVVCSETILKTPRPKWPADYYGLTVGNTRGFFVGGEAFYEAVEQGRITMEESRSTETNLLKLCAGRIDCYINDRRSIFFALARVKQDCLYKEGMAELREGVVVKKELGYLGVSKKFSAEWKEAFLARFNDVIGEMQASGEIERIASSYEQ